MKKLIFILSITLTLSAFAQVPNYVPTNGLVGWWPFNGNANDESGNGNNGTVNGATLNSDRFGNSNSAYNFDFVGKTWASLNKEMYIPFSNSLNVDNLTVSVWVFPRAYFWPGNMNDPNSVIIRRFQYGYSNPNGQVWGIGFNANSLSGFILAPSAQNNQASASVISNTPLALNEWHHIVMSYNGNTLSLFLNGSVVSSINTSLTLNTAGNSGISVGVSNQANGYWYDTDALIDDIGIWDRALTICEIGSLYNNQTNTSGLETVTECNSFTWGANNQTYSQSGQYIEILTNVAGCDSTVTLDLTITQPTTGSETITECNSFTWGANNQTYTSSGQYTEVLTNAVGCDSTVNLDLTITQPTTGSVTITECNSFTWGANNQTYTATGQYTEVLTNAVGCDSTVTLDLTITQPTTGSETITECNSFTWGANNQTYTSSGQYTEVLTNAVGCDSTVILDLIINSVDNGITQVDDFTLQANATGAAYQWIDCADESAVVGATNQQFAAAENGDYAVVVTQSGCSDTTECLSVSRLSISEHEQTPLVVYPNPATSMITIENPQGIASNYVVIDAQGRQVNAGKLQGETTSIDVAHIANGMYTITFEKNNLKDIKFIKK